MLDIYQHGAEWLRLFERANQHPAMAQQNNAAMAKQLIHDLIASELFTLEGLAREINILPDTLFALYTQANHEPSSSVMLALLQCHRGYFPGLYHF